MDGLKETLDFWKEWLTWLTLGEWAEEAIRWLRSNLSPLWDFIEEVLGGAHQALTDALNFLPALVMVALLALLAWYLRGWVFGLVSAVGLLLIDQMGQWELAMFTLAMVIVAVVLAAAIAIPIGIAAARSRAVSTVVKPILDFMQTLPGLLYVLVAVMFFGLGVVPGIVATIIFAMPPGIRLTELGIRQVDAEVVEAGHAFGSTPGRILQQIQFPLALPTIMAGVNQVIMLSLSMVVLAAFVGAGGLGGGVVEGLSRLNYALGFESGLSIVVLAIYLDRVTAALGARSAVARLEKAA
ncbi:MAG: ABC transporter permease [Natronosporangium sp.]